MSVPSSLRGEGQLVVITKTNTLAEHMDDFILIHPDKEYLKYCKTEIEKRINDLGLILNRKKLSYSLWHNLLNFLVLLSVSLTPVKLYVNSFLIKYLTSGEN